MCEMYISYSMTCPSRTALDGHLVHIRQSLLKNRQATASHVLMKHQYINQRQIKINSIKPELNIRAFITLK